MAQDTTKIGVVELDAFFPDETCNKKCANNTMCQKCINELEFVVKDQRPAYMCVPKSNPHGCRIMPFRVHVDPSTQLQKADIGGGLLKGKDPKAFGGKAADPDRTERVLKILAETPQKIGEIERQREQRQRDWDAYDKAKGKK